MHYFCIFDSVLSAKTIKISDPSEQLHFFLNLLTALQYIYHRHSGYSCVDNNILLW